MADKLRVPRMSPPIESEATTTSIRVKWAPNPLANHYHLQFCKNTRFDTWKTAAQEITGTEFLIENLLPATAYLVRLRAAYFKDNVWGAYSDNSEVMSTSTDQSQQAQGVRKPSWVRIVCLIDRNQKQHHIHSIHVAG